MQQPTTAEVRLDEHKAASSAQRSRAFCRFGCQRVGCDRISLRRASLRRKIAANNFGIQEMSVWMNTVDDYVWAVIVAPAGHAEVFGGFGKLDEQLCWTKEEALSEAEKKAHDMLGATGIEWSVVDEDIVIGRFPTLPDHVVVVRGVRLPDKDPPPLLKQRYKYFR